MKVVVCGGVAASRTTKQAAAGSSCLNEPPWDLQAASGHQSSST
jgi:hypothetical protein